MVLTLTLLLAARLLGPGDFGRFAALQAVGLLAAGVWNGGIASLLTREIAAGRLAPADGLRRGLALRLRLTPLWLLALVAGMAVLHSHDPNAPFTLLSFGAFALLAGLQDLPRAVLKGRQRFRHASAALLAGRLVTLALTLAITAAAPAAALAFLGLALAGGALMTTCLGLWRQGIGPPSRAAGAPAPATVTLRAAAPFAAISMMQLAYNRVDVLLVAALATPAVLSAYAPASRIQDALILVPSAVGSVTLPVVSSLLARGVVDAERLHWLWLLVTVAAVGVSSLLAAAVWLAAPYAVPRLLGAVYQPSVAPVRIIAWSIPIIAFNSVLTALLHARRQSPRVAGAIGAALVTALGLTAALVPALGASGAALAATLREMPVAVALVVAARAGGMAVSLQSARTAKAAAPRGG
ncbi:MAG: oligosaccharide flippase family protein [Dehalococcoidia bacterium]